MTELEQLLDQLQRSGEQVRATQLSALSEVDSSELATLERTWPRIPASRRRAIVEMMNEIAEDNVDFNFEGAFRTFLTDEDPVVRLRAIEGLWECGDPKLIDRLFSILRSDPEERIRSAAATALGRFVLLGQLGELRQRYVMQLEAGLIEVYEDSDESPAVRRRAIEALGSINEERISELIEDAYNSDDEELRVGAIYAMGQSADTRWLSILQDEAESERPECRYEAAVALGELEAEEGVPTLVRLLGDVDPEVRRAAIGALGKIGGREAERALKRLLKGGDPEMREAAEDALTELQFYDDILNSRGPAGYS